VAYVGPPLRLADLLYDPPHSLVRQSWAPRHQRYGTINVDGYGVGWYAPELRAEPARYRRAGAIWTDRSLLSMAPVITSGAILGAVRSATPPAPSEESGAAPFSAGRWLWSLNGAVTADLVALRRSLSAGRAAALEGVSDSEVLFALFLDRLDGGVTPVAALTGLITAVPGRLNVLLTNGQSIWATACGDSLTYRMWAGGMVVASEPFDDDPAWRCVPDRSLVVADASQCSITTLQQEERSV
jgi:glutamine amidotransferase